MIKGLVYPIVPGTHDYNRDFKFISAWLLASEWGSKLTEKSIKGAMEHSTNFGIYEMEGLNPIIVGFARVVSDEWLFSSICDFIVREDRRRQGLGRTLIEHILAKPGVAGTECILHTTYARPFYAKFGFKPYTDGVMIRPPSL